jgi:hypothetical protein
VNLLRLSSLFDSQPPFLEASEDLGVELRQRVSLLMKKWDPDKAKELADWMTKNFTFGASRTPQGQKKLKGDLAWLHRLLKRS